jgi:hypothetical protein
MEWKIVTQNLPTSAGTFDVDLTGFGTADAALFLTNTATEDSVTAHANLGIGAVDSAGNQWSVSLDARDNVTLPTTGTEDVEASTVVHTTGKCVVHSEGGSGSSGTVVGEASLDSITTDKITLDSSADAFDSAFQLTTIAIKDVTNAHVGTSYVDCGAVGNTTDITLAFDPDVLIVVHDLASISYFPNQWATSLGLVTLGDSSTQVSHASYQRGSVDNQQTQSQGGYFTRRGGKIIAAGQWPGLVFSRIPGGTGFRVTHEDGSTSDPNTARISYLALKFDGEAYVGTTSPPQTTGNLVTTSPGFQPEGLLVLGTAYHNNASSGPDGSGHSSWHAGVGSVGVSTGIETDRSLSYSMEDYAATTNTSSGTSSNILHVLDDEGAAYSVGSLASFDSTGFTLTMSTNPTEGPGILGYLAWRTITAASAPGEEESTEASTAGSTDNLKSLNATTELEAVNIMLTAVGSSPVSDLTGGAEVAIAKNILTETRREVLSRGWAFNYETKVTLQANSDDEILLAENVLRIDGTDGYNTSLDLVQRGTKLYDRKNHTYKVTEKVTADVIYNFTWSLLPEVCRRYIMIRAARVFADRVIGYGVQHQYTLGDEYQALTDLKDAEGDTADHNMLTGNWDVVRVLHRRSPSGDVSF